MHVRHSNVWKIIHVLVFNLNYIATGSSILYEYTVQLLCYVKQILFKFDYTIKIKIFFKYEFKTSLDHYSSLILIIINIK